MSGRMLGVISLSAVALIGGLGKFSHSSQHSQQSRAELYAENPAMQRRDQPLSPPEVIQASLASQALTTGPFAWLNPGPVNLSLGSTKVSGKLQAFAWEPSHPQVMYAGGGNGAGNEGPFSQAGAFKTVDGGVSWTSINQGLIDTAVNVLWIDVSNPNLLLAGTEFGGLFRTTDGGDVWIQVSPNSPVSAVVSVPGGILAGTGKGFEFSGDGGRTWSLLQRTSSPIRCIASSGSTIAAGLEDGEILWKNSADQTWRTVATNQRSTAWDIVLDPVDADIGYYTLGYEPTRVFATIDGGKTWKLIIPPINGFAQALAIRPADRALLVAGQGMFFASKDRGATWTASNAPWDTRRIFILPNSSSLVLGSDHGLHWTDDGGRTWLDLTGNVSSTILYSVAVNGNTIFASSQDFGPFVSLDAGKTWANPSGPLAEGGAVSINPSNPKYCYAFTISGFATSKDGCSTFTAVRGPTWKYFDRASSQNLITVDPRNPSTVYVGAYDGVWSSSDFGQTFTKLSWPVQQVSNVVLDPQDPMAIYICANAGFYQSLNGGISWKKLTLPTPFPIPNAATISPTDSNVILVALVDGAGRSPGGILRSTDRGASFAFSNQGLSTANFNLGVDQQAIAFNPSPAAGTLPVVALATTGGLYASADLGKTWQDIRFNAIPHVFSSLYWDRDYLWITTYGEGILRTDRPLTLGTLGSTLVVSGGPLSFTNTVGVLPSSESRVLQLSTNGVIQRFTASAVFDANTVCGSNWLTITPSTGATTGTAVTTALTVSYTVAGLPHNTNTTCAGWVIISAGDSGGSPAAVPVTLVISPRMDVTAVTNGASFAPNPSPGSVASLVGENLAAGPSSANSVPLPIVLSGVSISVNGTQCPLWYVSPQQITFELPTELSPGAASVVVSYGSTSSPAFQFTVGQATPGIFTYDTNRAIATDSFGSLIDGQHHAQSGTTITVYLTGIGPVDQAVSTNTTSPYDPIAQATLPASATIGNVPAPIQFLGLVPGAIALAQAKLNVPVLVPGDYPVSITIGGTASNAPLITIGPSQ